MSGAGQATLTGTVQGTTGLTTAWTYSFYTFFYTFLLFCVFLMFFDLFWVGFMEQHFLICGKLVGMTQDYNNVGTQVILIS